MTEEYTGHRFPVQRFQEIKRLNPYWSSYICFVEALKTVPGISNRIMRKYFRELVDEDDYVLEEREEVLNYLKTEFLKAPYSPLKSY